MCCGHLILDTQIACRACEKFCHNDQWYHGYTFEEFDPSFSEAVKEGFAWAAHKNNVSFVLTKSSLFAALVNAGFDTVVEGVYPYDFFPFKDYTFVIGSKADPMMWKTTPELGDIRLAARPERDGRDAQNPYLASNTVTHPDSTFVVPSEFRDICV
jgi:hypothetical protein